MKKFTLINEKKKINKKVFLGGTCNNSKWRNKLIKKLDIDYFNPVVDEWDDEAYEEELKQRKICDYLLYVITPKMTGFYSIAEVIDDSNKKPEKTIFCYLKEDGELEFSEDQLKSLKATSKMIEENGGACFDNLDEIAEYLNKES